MVSHRYTPISPGEDKDRDSNSSGTSPGSRSSTSSSTPRSSLSFSYGRSAATPISRLLLTLPPLICSAFLAICFFLSILSPSSTSIPSSSSRPNRNGVTPLPPTLQSDLTLPQSQCRAEFPLFYPQLDELKAYWRNKKEGRTGIQKAHIDALESSAKQQERWGWSRVIVKSNRLWLRTHHESQERGGTHRQRSMLALLQQAIQTSPSADGPLPAVDLILSTGDRDVFPTYSGEPAWVLAKHRLVPQTAGQWLAPDFGFMAWPEAQLPPHAEVVELQREQEALYPWEKKDDRAFWRGFPNPAYAIRRELLERTRNASHLPPHHPDAWADVFGTSFGPEAAQPDFAPLVPIEEHCRRKYLLHAEGNSYSGRGKFLLTCHAVTVAHPLDWVQHFHAALIGDREDRRRNWVELPGPGWEGLEEAIRGLWETDGDAKASRAGTQGTKPLPVEGGWLAAARAKGILPAAGSKAARLTARDIADNARDSLRDRYLTPAATACYFRAALRAYAESMDVKSWGSDGEGPRVRPGNGQSPGKDLGQPGAKGDISYDSWFAADAGDWPPAAMKSGLLGSSSS